MLQLLSGGRRREIFFGAPSGKAHSPEEVSGESPHIGST